MDAKTIILKALVDKERNRIIYVESDADFVDILFSFLTMPLGTIIRLTRNHPPVTELGCISNLYASVENLDAKFLRTEACNSMLLFPRNAAADHCKNLKLQIDNTDSTERYFICSKSDTSDLKCKLLSFYKNASCRCGCPMDIEQKLYEPVLPKAVRKLGFVYEVARFVISDELEVQPISSAFIFSLLAKHGIEDSSAVEERSFEIGANEVLNLLKFSLLSKCALTDTLLQQTCTGGGSTRDFGQAGFVKREAQEDAPIQNGKISIRLITSKSKKTVFYAEGKRDFADLLFSFLTVPIGHVFKETCCTSSSGCFQSLYKSVQGLDAGETLLSTAKKDILLSPKVANWYSFPDQLLDLEEVGCKNLEYFWEYANPNGYCLTTNKSYLSLPNRYCLTTNKSYPNGYRLGTNSSHFSSPGIYSASTSALTLMDPKSRRGKSTSSSGAGFVSRGGMFTVTDDLMVTPISSLSGLSILKSLKVPYSDIEERMVLVGKDEALALLVAAMNGSRSILSDVFLPDRRQSKRRKRAL